ncbi:MAG: helix-turn-helix domain-containing protein [Haloarculaceae archaeon]
MAHGICAELEIGSPTFCEITAHAPDAHVEEVVRSATAEGGERATDFVVDADATVTDAEPVFDYGSKVCYRIRGGCERDCVCRVIERKGVPIDDVVVDGRTHVLQVYVTDPDAVGDLVADLRADFADVSLRRLTAARPDGSDGDLVLIDREMFTERQRSVMETAHDLGYFEYPKRANAGEVADALDITRSTFTEHLAAAQSKLLDAVVRA